MLHPSAVTAYGPYYLRCEYLEEPLGIETARPRLSWLIHADPQARGLTQRAYQIMVASTRQKLEWDQADIWDSGQIASDQSNQIPFAGPALTSRQRCWWKVRLWLNDNKPTAWSPASFWEMGLLQREDWRASWIVAPLTTPDGAPLPCPQLRRRFVLNDQPRQARLYISTLGMYDLFVNGQRATDAIFTPGWTDYSLRANYQTYDIAPLLRAGPNVLAVQLARGWYASRLGWPEKNVPCYGPQPALLAQLETELNDGSTLLLSSDDSWKCARGPLLDAQHYDGETTDARLAIPGWDTPDLDDASWSSCQSIPWPGSVPPADEAKIEGTDWTKRVGVMPPTKPIALTSSPNQPMRRIDTLAPLTQAAPAPLTRRYDFGQNLVGRLRLHIPAATPAGTTFTLRHAEVLNPDGTLYLTNLRRAQNIDTYISAGGATTWEPQFVFHGFRHAELTLTPPADSRVDPQTFLPKVEAIVTHTAMPPAGEFECSDPLINQLQHNIVWGQKGNFIDVPTDCPQRDERLGWTGDAQVFCATAMFNYDVAAFFTKWLIDLNDAQAPGGAYPMVAPDVLAQRAGDGGPGWADAGIILPWTLYLTYGDKTLLERHYDAMVRYVDYAVAADIRQRHNFGDWLHHDAHTPLDLIALAFAAHSADLMSHIAKVLDRKPDATRFATTFRRLKKEFIHQFVTPAGRVLGDTQTGYVLALAFNLLPEELRPPAVAHLRHDIAHGRYTNTWKNRNHHLSTGFLGVKYLTFALTAAGHADLAYRLLLTEDYPSWLFPVKNGATTIWERWDGWTPDKGFQDPGMNSFNHYAYGAIGQWLYQCVAGVSLDPEHPGYKRTLIRPVLPPTGSAAAQRITWARLGHDSIHGRITAHWRRTAEQFELDVVIPPNTTAIVTLPCGSTEAVRESGRPLIQTPGLLSAKAAATEVSLTFGSGRYALTCPLPT